MTSLLEDLMNETLFEDTIKQLTTDNMCSILLDFSNEEELRFRALQLFYEKKGYEVVEILKKLVSIFAFAPTKILERFFVKVLNESSIPFTLKLETSKDICIYKDDSDPLFETLDRFIFDMKNNDITGAQQYEAITTLFRNNNFVENGTSHFLQFISEKDTSSEYRYKMILSLETTFNLRKRWATKEEKEILDQTRKNIQEKCFILFLETEYNTSYYRILSAQNLVVNFAHCDKNSICNHLLCIAQNENEEYNLRADATDVVLRYGENEAKEKATQIIMDLGKTDNNFTIYGNAQNAHNVYIENSAIKTLERLNEIPVMKINTKTISFQYVCDKILDSIDEKAKIALNRIRLDNALYGNMSISLKSALVSVYSFIQTNEDYKDFLMTRLYEELSESAGICSTGIMERLVNTFSGVIDDFGIKISVEDQILANVHGKLNKKIMDLTQEECLHKQDIRFCSCLKEICDYGKTVISNLIDEENKKIKKCESCVVCVQFFELKEIMKTRFLKREDVKCVHVCTEHKICNESLIELILEEMSIPVKYFQKRQTFRLFFRKKFPFIFDELYEDYKTEIDHLSFDLYMRKAVIKYVGED
jgi:hypothetical protein